MEYYNSANSRDQLPKVVFKFGSTHMYRGLSIFHQFDLGNTASELAEMNNLNSVHFHVSGIKGMSQGFDGQAHPFDNSAGLHPLIKQILEERQKDGWVLFDMRLLRKELKQQQLEEIKDVAFGYDFWIYIPEAQALTSL